jgi:hypothetical protein
MKSKINVILLGILIFVLGGVAGAVSYSLYWRYFYKPPKPPNFVETMAKEVQLDANQIEKIKVIANETRGSVVSTNRNFMPQYEAINKVYWTQMDSIRRESDQKIKSVLREDQKALFEKFLKTKYPPPQMKRPQYNPPPKK